MSNQSRKEDNKLVMGKGETAEDEAGERERESKESVCKAGQIAGESPKTPSVS